MNGVKVTSGIAAFVVMFMLSFIWHEVLMGDYYAQILASVARAEPNLVLIGAGYLITAMVMAYVYPIGYKGGSGVGEGLRFGAVIGLLWWLPANVVLAGVYETTLTSGLVDGAWHIVEGAGGGIVIGMLHARGAGGTAAGSADAGAG